MVVKLGLQMLLLQIYLYWEFNDNITGFVLDRSMDGIITTPIENKLSMNNTKTGMIFLENVRVPKKNKLNVTGLKGPLTALNSARIGLSMGCLGAANSCIDISLDYTKNRNLFGGFLAEKQIVQSKLVDMITNYNSSMALTIQILEELDEEKYFPEMISMIKMNNPKIALDIARTSRDLLGGNGIIGDYNVFRHMANLETVNTYEGTHDIHKLILGKYLTGFSAF